MKKVVILEHGGGELANQLWNFSSIYAYCKEREYNCQNYSFFEYGHYFDIPIDNKIINHIFFETFEGYHGRRNSFRTKFWRFIYKLYTKTIVILFYKQLVSSENIEGRKYNLPPSAELNSLSEQEGKYDTLYFIGWLFRNPVGIVKFRKEIVQLLKPRSEYRLEPENTITESRKTYKYIIGVHVRQTDYRIHKGGKYFIQQEKVRVVLDEYLSKTNRASEETLFVVTSDEPIKEELFAGLNILIHRNTPIEDLYLLSLCDAIIGSNSSFGNFAAYYGNKPHIIFQKEPVDWDYYKDKLEYFENKYSVMTS